MNFSLPGTPKLGPEPGPSLRIKTPEKLVVLTYDQMKKKLVDDGLLDYDSIISDDRARSVCIYVKTNVKYVLKMGSHEVRGDTTKFKLLRNEDKIYKALDQLPEKEKQYFAKIYDSDVVDDKFYYIIMEFINGITLYDYITHTYQTHVFKSRKEGLHILLQLTKALKALFSLGLVHGDLSVENVMIEPDFNVKLIDFEKTSADIKLEKNTYGNTGLDINNSQDQGVGYFFLVVKLVSAIEDSIKFKPLLGKIKSLIDSCSASKCKNLYAECEKVIQSEFDGGRRTRKMGRRKRVRQTRFR
jgi:hypothetical protein